MTAATVTKDNNYPHTPLRGRYSCIFSIKGLEQRFYEKKPTEKRFYVKTTDQGIGRYLVVSRYFGTKKVIIATTDLIATNSEVGILTEKEGKRTTLLSKETDKKEIDKNTELATFKGGI